MSVTEESAPSAGTTRWTAQWKELYDEVVTSGLCTGCAGCVVACPHDVIGYNHESGGYRPFHLEEELGVDNCVHGEKGCTSCTRACPRFRNWETEANTHLFAEDRQPDQMYGIYKDLLLCRASDDFVHQNGQDGGFVSALLIWAMEQGYIDGALASFLEGDGSTWVAKPGVARNKEEIIASAGSRYTYSANTLALDEALEQGLSKLALVGMSCQSSVPPVMWSRKIGKISKPFVFNIGLLCSKTFDDAIFPELFEAKYGIKRETISKMNIKGVFQIWTKDGGYHEIDLKECHGWTREGCKHCPDFAAEHADISTGGIGEDNDWTLVIVRTDLGREIVSRMISSGAIISRPADSDEKAMKLLRTLSIVSRRRWLPGANPAVSVGVPPPKKKAAASGGH
ncbi:MAG: Coenzyme F420 hydrogenase/dehydrogenase, beta subunit C-terminal domain [Acidimicrobiia bacterium]